MATTFQYKVRDGEGRFLEGSIEADSKELVGERLRELGYTPIAVEGLNDSPLRREITIPGFGNRLKLRDLAVFSRQFATMINSGLNLTRALHVLGEQTENKTLAGIVTQVGADVEKGASLSAALGRHPKVFNRLYVAMVKAGEAGGALDGVLMQLASTIEKQVELRRKIRSAMTYPCAVLALVVLIVMAMLLFVVPTFESLFDDLGGQLPLPTKILLAVSGLVTTLFPFLVLGTVGAVFGFKRWINTEAGRASWDTAKLKIPVFGRLVHKTAMTRFARTLAVLLRSGVSILESLEITAETVNNTVVSRAVRDVQRSVQSGESIAAPLGRHDVFPPMVVQMLAVGEETGCIDEMLDKVGEFYEQEVEATVASLTSLLEPLLIVVLGGAVGSMVVALYMPMFRIITLIE